mmetsp:Transcript_27938/g.73288  ORF Transcript_27938/g.73288 Transcript_27938/m.73288 type:complete len:252 (+) Transcript_27938:22-777(+)
MYPRAVHRIDKTPHRSHRPPPQATGGSSTPPPIAHVCVVPFITRAASRSRQPVSPLQAGAAWGPPSRAAGSGLWPSTHLSALALGVRCEVRPAPAGGEATNEWWLTQWSHLESITPSHCLVIRRSAKGGSSESDHDEPSVSAVSPGSASTCAPCASLCRAMFPLAVVTDAAVTDAADVAGRPTPDAARAKVATGMCVAPDGSPGPASGTPWPPPMSTAEYAIGALWGGPRPPPAGIPTRRSGVGDGATSLL